MDQDAYTEWEKQTLRYDSTAWKLFHVLCFHFHSGYDDPRDVSWNDLTKMDAAQPYTRPIIGIGMVNDKGKGDFVLLQKTFRGFLLGRDRAVIDDVFANTQQHNELSKHDVSTFAKKIGLPGYVQSDVLRFRLHEGSARIHNPNVMRRFSYNYWPVEKGHPPSMEDYGPDC